MKYISLFLALALTVWAADERRLVIPDVPKPFDEVVLYAQTKGLPYGSLGKPADRGPLPGDRALLLVSLFEGGSLQQWLIELELQGRSLAEAKVNAPPSTTFYTSTGDKVEFSSMIIPMQVRLHGPFKEQQKLDAVKSEEARVQVNASQLALGFDRAAGLILRLKEQKTAPGGAKAPGGFSFGMAPFPDDVVARDKALAESLQITSKDIEALAGSGPALVSFFEIARDTPGLKDVLWEVVDMPSMWSVVRNGGKVGSFFHVEGGLVTAAPTRSNMPPQYFIPIKMLLNNQPALDLTFLATAPQPPLLTTAGIVTVFAQHPSKKDKRAVIQILGAQAATSPGQ